jgi:hypothetical protein
MSNKIPNTDEFLEPWRPIFVNQVIPKEFKQAISERIAAEREPDWQKVDYQDESSLPALNTPVLCHITYDSKKLKPTYAVLKRVNEDDCDWRTVDDNSDLSFWVNVTHWKPFAALTPQVSEGVKP